MSHAEFIRLVRELRKAQEDYKRSRRYDDHARAEDLGRKVDEYLEYLEQPVLPGIDEEGIPGKDFIPVEWVDACERYGKWKIVRVEQPVEGEEEPEYYQHFDPDC